MGRGKSFVAYNHHGVGTQT